MHEDPLLTTVIAVVALLLIAAAAAIGLKRLRVPFTVGLVLVGLLLGTLRDRVGALDILGGFSLSPDLILFVFLPTLIFESAFNLHVRLLARNLTPVLVLAAPGLVLSTLIVGALMQALTPLGWGPALVFGALISATDPVAVIALFKDVGAPRRLAILVEGESLFNDATAIVLYAVLVPAALSGMFGGEVLAAGGVDFVRVFAGGLVVGAAIGYVMIRTIALAEDEPLVEVALSTVVAYAAFIVAEHYLAVSGVMATVGAGMVVGALGSTRFTPEVQAYLRQFWEYAAFVANSLIFLLVGLSIDLASLATFAAPIGWAILVVLGARAAVVFGLVPVVNRLPGAEPVDHRYQAIMFWGGLRGAVALALALSLPTDFPGRDLVIALSLGLVLFTLLTGGLSMKPLIHALGLDRPDAAERVARAQGQLAAKRRAVNRLEDLATGGHFLGRVIGELTTSYREDLDHAERHVEQVCRTEDFGGDTMLRVLLTQAVTVEHSTYHRLFQRGLLSEAVLHELEIAVDLQRDALKRGEILEEVPAQEPLEVRVASWTAGLVARVVPNSSVRQRQQLRTLSAHYEREVAIHRASTDVLETIHRLAELANVDDATEHACRALYERRSQAAMDRIDTIAEHFPEYATALQERTALRIALDAEADAIEDLARAGAISSAVARDARRRVETAHRKAFRQPVRPTAPDPRELLAKVPFFQELSAEDAQRVVQQLRPRTVLRGERIITQGERGSSLFLIGRGVVAVMVSTDGDAPRRVASLHAGDFFGEMALLTDEPRAATVEAVTPGQLFELHKSAVNELCEVCGGIRQALQEAADRRAAGLRESGSWMPDEIPP